MEKTIICLANSRKISGRCVAGKDVTDGTWLRPVSKRDTHEISEEDRRYEDGTTAQVMDVITIPCREAQPHGHQPENVLIDDKYYWAKVRTATFEELTGLADDGPLPWGNDSSYTKINDRVPEAQLVPQHGSLRLIYLDRVTLVVGPKAPDFNDMKRVVRAEFTHHRSNYRLDVTDPVIERQYLQRGDGRYVIESAYLCVSLGELYNGYAYKLVATIITQE